MKLMRGVPAALIVFWMEAAMHAADEPKKPAVEVGKPSPDFTLKDQDGKDVKLSDLKGKKNVLIAFYPKDFTGGCTAEMKGFREKHEFYVKHDVLIFGVSTDPVDSHKKFCQSLDLPFPLLADTEGKVSKLYGVLTTRGKDILSSRSVFLVKKDGTVAHADAEYKLNPADDSNALTKAIEGLGGAKSEPKKE